jgi:hypothetical protein
MFAQQRADAARKEHEQRRCEQTDTGTRDDPARSAGIERHDLVTGRAGFWLVERPQCIAGREQDRHGKPDGAGHPARGRAPRHFRRALLAIAQLLCGRSHRPTKPILAHIAQGPRVGVVVASAL